MGKLSCWATKYLNTTGGRGSGEFDVALEGEHVASTKNEGGAAATRGKYVTPATRGGDVNITENEAVAAVRSEDVAVMDMIPWQACKPR